MTDKAIDYPPRFQFEPSSGSLYRSQVNNCGPTGAAQQIDYYKGREGTTRIEWLRDAANVPHGTPTSAWDQAQMLIAVGIPASVLELNTLEDLDALIGWGDRPVGIGIEMSRLRASTRGHTFLGWHRITILKRQRRKLRSGKWQRGYIYTDPNFSPLGGYRADPMKGHRYISRGELEYAFLRNAPRYAIVPNRRKV